MNKRPRRAACLARPVLDGEGYYSSLRDFGAGRPQPVTRPGFGIGPTGHSSYQFFGGLITRDPYRSLPQAQNRNIDNPRDMFDMLNQRERAIYEAMRAHDPNTPRYLARAQAAREWNAEYFNPQNPVFQKVFSGRRAVGFGA